MRIGLSIGGSGMGGQKLRNPLTENNPWAARITTVELSDDEMEDYRTSLPRQVSDSTAISAVNAV
jgi:hypothetical protein